MGLFILEGDAEKLAPIAEQLGLELSCENEYRTRWARRFPKSRKTPRKPSVSKAPDAYGTLDGQKGTAIAYARWLAQRDGVELPTHGACSVIFRDVKWFGYKMPIKQAVAVQFGGVKIRIPHVGYDPTAPVTEELED